jgi:spore coat protein H
LSSGATTVPDTFSLSVPWDLDRAFANFFMFGSPEQQMDLSLRHPYGGKHRLTERLLSMPEMSDRYDALPKSLAEDCFAKPRLLAELEVIEGAIREARDRDAEVADENREEAPQRPHWGGHDEIPDLRTFVEQRSESVAKQLADATAGYVPRGGFGPPPGCPPEPQR